MLKEKIQRSKMQILFASLVLIVALIMIIRLIYSFAEQSTYKYTEEVADHNSQIVKTTLEIAMQSAADLASVSSGYRVYGITDRHAFEMMMKKILQDQPQIFGVWTVWAPNSFDGKDAAAGRFIPYWYRNKHDVQLGFCHGLDSPSTNQYYLLPVMTGKSQIIGPYKCLAGNTYTEMISLAVPIRCNGKIVGVAGADISAGELQRIVKVLHPYDVGYGVLISNQGMITAHQDMRYIGQQLSADVAGKGGIEAIKQGKKWRGVVYSEYLRRNVYRVFSPIEVSGCDDSWSLSVNVPIEKAYESQNEMLLYIGLIALITGFLIINAMNKIRKYSGVESEMQEMAKRNTELEQEKEKLQMLKEELSAMYAQTAAMNHELEFQIEEKEKSYFATISALAKALEANDKYTKGHCERVTQYAIVIAQEMGINSREDLQNIRYGGLLHDIGKIGISDVILNKKSALDADEILAIKEHPIEGFEICQDIDFLNDSLDIILQHHERIDGNGYPNKIQGEDINILARIVCVADAYDAMTSDRAYRRSMTPETALDELIACKGTQFDADVVDALVRCFDRVNSGDFVD